MEQPRPKIQANCDDDDDDNGDDDDDDDGDDNVVTIRHTLAGRAGAYLLHKLLFLDQSFQYQSKRIQIC